MTQENGAERNPRDFDCCAYRSQSGKTGCGALRYYHDNPVHQKRHKFVEPIRKPTVEEERDALLGEVAELKTEVREVLDFCETAMAASEPYVPRDLEIAIRERCQRARALMEKLKCSGE